MPVYHCQCITAGVSLLASPSRLHLSRFASPLKRLQPSPVSLPEVPHVLGSVGMTVLFSCKSCVNSPSVSCLCSHLYMYTCLSMWGAACWMSAQIIYGVAPRGTHARLGTPPASCSRYGDRLPPFSEAQNCELRALPQVVIG